MKKIIITERQAEVIVRHIQESNAFDKVLGKIIEDLDLNYEPAMGTHEMGNEFYNSPLISKKVDGNTITPAELYEYLTHKHIGLNPEFIKKTINDWYGGNFKGTGVKTLSKNVSFR